ncbi:hypothetical protein DMENIID0001_058400 [Sergentomyia squamirostris]
MEEASILRLNDYCLLEIFSYLNIWELIQVEQVCERFQNLIQVIYARQWKKLDFYQLKKEMNISFFSTEAQVIAEKVGEHVKELKIVLDNDEDHLYEWMHNLIRPIRPILLNCFENLERLHIEALEGFNFGENMEILNGIYHQLESLQLIKCNLSDNMIDGLEFAANLRILNLSINLDIRGSFLPFLRNIEEVSLSKCFSVDPTNLADMFRNNPSIRSLDIAYCKQINQECINSLSRNLQNLEILGIGENKPVNLRNLADLPKLIQLLLYCGGINDLEAFLERLAARDQLEYLNVTFLLDSDALKSIKKFSKLKYLRINTGDNGDLLSLLKDLSCKDNLVELDIGGSTNVNSEDVLKCVKSCKALKVLNVEYCEDITDRFVTDLLPHLSSRSGLLEIRTHHSGITENLTVKHPKLKLN